MPRLTIIGASARAAAGSARRAGFDPWCADLFGDTDLKALAPGSVRCPADRYPRGFADILRGAPAAPWMYTGGLENHPELIRKLAGVRPLWGNGPEALARSRCPFTVNRLLVEAGLPAPEVRAAGSGRPSLHRWLRKPLAGSAGQGIAFADESRPAPSAASRRGYYEQQFIDRPAMSGVFVRENRETRFLGVTRQLVSEPWLNARPFRYAGNIGPVRLPSAGEDELRHIGRVLGDGCGLAGVFGVDFIWKDGHCWVVEVNPRYPASAEVIERASGAAVLAEHAAAFARPVPPPAPPDPGPVVVGKAILYAPRRLVMPELGLLRPEDTDQTFDRRSIFDRYADVPHAGEVVESGWPVLTVFAEGQTMDDCRRALQARTDEVSRLLWKSKDETASTII